MTTSTSTPTPLRRLVLIYYCLVWTGLSISTGVVSVVSGFQFVHTSTATLPTTSRQRSTSSSDGTTIQPKNKCQSGFFRRSILRSSSNNNNSNNNSDNENGSSTSNGGTDNIASASEATGTGTASASASAAVKDDKNNPHNEKFDWKTAGKQFKLFLEMAGPYYKESVEARYLLAAVLVLTLVNSGISVLFSYLGKDFWNALSTKDVEGFAQILQKYVAALLVGAPVITAYRYQREQLSVHWREWMTVRTFQLYTQNRVYYSLERSTAIDNPDQRIAEDVDSFTSYSLTLLITILTSLIDLGSFSLILWNIYPQLYYALIGYAVFGTVVTTSIGSNLVGLNFSQLQREADLRYALVRLRDNSESIAFYAGEDIEGRAVEQRVGKVMGNKRDLNAAKRNLEFFTNAYRYMVQIIPVAVVAPKYFAGEIGLGVISQSAGAFNHILNDLSIIVNQFESLSTFSAGVDRLSTFYEAMRDVDTKRGDDFQLLQMGPKNETSTDANGVTTWTVQSSTEMQEANSITLHDLESRSAMSMAETNGQQHDDHKNKMILSMDHLELCTPDQKRILISDLCMNLYEGENLLIVGNSGAGKSSLLRAIAGLWTVGSGSISRPASDEVYFLPQRPYCTMGTLRDQLLYPSLDAFSEVTSDDDATAAATTDKGHAHASKSHRLKESITDDDLLEVLEKVDLLDVAARAGDGDPVKGLQAVLDWSNMLSLGEQQRLAFGRLLVNRPRLVVLDEASSALDMVAEARMYSLLQGMAKKTLSKDGKLSAPGMTYISVGHRPSLIAYHDKRLRLDGAKTEYEITDIEKSPVQIPQITNL
jgi:putative ATP-binding cassette transporter